MWIERIDFAGFGSISGELILFRRDKLNLVVEPNESGKSTMTCAIWAILYDFSLSGAHSRPGAIAEREALKPRASSGLPFIAGIDVVFNGRKLKVIRDFSDGAVQVIDLDRNNADVTGEFMGRNGKDEVGLRLTGMTRELFLSTCFVGQRDLSEHAFGEYSDPGELFQSMSDSSQPGNMAAQAMAVVNDTLFQFPYRGNRYKIEMVIHDLETRFQDLFERVKKYEEDRRTMGLDLMRISELDSQIDNSDGIVRANEYFNLCLEAADIDNRLIQTQETLLKVQEIKQEIERIADAASFPADQVKQVEDLWVRRQSRFTDYNRLNAEFGGKIEEYETLEGELSERYPGLTAFTPEQGQALGSLSVTFGNLMREIDELRQKREAELNRLQALNVDLEQLNQIRRALVNMEARDYDDARSYSALIGSFQEGIKESERAILRANLVVNEIEDQKKSKKSLFPMPGGAAKKKEQLAAEQEIDKQNKHIEELKSKILGLEGRLDNLGRRAGMKDGKELHEQLQLYQSQSANLKDLDALEQVLIAREQALDKVKAELQSLFQKAGLDAGEVSSERGLELTAAVNSMTEEKRNIDTTFGPLKQSKQQLDFLKAEIRDVDNLLKATFARAQVEPTDDMDDGYHAFFSRLASFHRWQALTNELRMLEVDMSSGFTPDELPPQIVRLEAQRLEVWESMEQMAADYADIAEIEPVQMVPRDEHVNADALGTATRKYVDDLRKERDSLTLKVRTSTMNYDVGYMGALAEMEVVERDLHNIRRARMALELARDTLKQLSGQTYVDWSAKLNEIAERMLENLGLGYDYFRFEKDLSFTAKQKGDSEPVSSYQASKMSTGTKEQLHWLARMVVTRFLARGNPLPIILDEPFSECDDSRFLRIMRFLIDMMSRDHQVIILSCHQQQHQWLLDNLSAEQKERVRLCRRAPLSADPVPAS